MPIKAVSVRLASLRAKLVPGIQMCALLVMALSTKISFMVSNVLSHVLTEHLLT